MIGAALSRRGGRLKLGLRLGKPPIVVPGATLDNTLGTSTIAGTSVQNYGAGYADQLRAALATAGYTMTTPNSASVATFVNEFEAACASLEATAPAFPIFSISNATAVSEGDPVAPALPVFSIGNAATVSEGN